jgi:hypothetical protein
MRQYDKLNAHRQISHYQAVGMRESLKPQYKKTEPNLEIGEHKHGYPNAKARWPAPLKIT